MDRTRRATLRTAPSDRDAGGASQTGSAWDASIHTVAEAVCNALAATSELGAAIDGVLVKTGLALNASHAFFLDETAPSRQAESPIRRQRGRAGLHLWTAPPHSARPLDVEGLIADRSLSDALAAGPDGVISIGDTTSLDQPLRARLERQDVHSLLLLPLVVSGTRRAVLGIVDVASAHPWSADQVALVRMVGNALATRLALARVADSVHAARERMDVELAYRDAVMRHADLGLCGMELAGTPAQPVVIAWNQHMERLTGYSAADLTHHGTLRRILGGEPALRSFAKVVAQVVQTGRRERVEWSLRHADGERVPAAMTVCRVPNGHGPRHPDNPLHELRDVGARGAGEGGGGKDVHVVVIVENLAEQLELQARLQEQAVRDPLTGVFNRRYLHDFLFAEADAAKRDERTCTVCMIDIDCLKEVNDLFGHPVGDALLRGLAKVLRSNARASDVVVRYGGDEFVVLVGDDSDATPRLGSRFRRAFDGWMAAEIAARALPQGVAELAGLSVGFATLNDYDTATLEKALALADARMYEDKRQRKEAAGSGRRRSARRDRSPKRAEAGEAIDSGPTGPSGSGTIQSPAAKPPRTN